MHAGSPPWGHRHWRSTLEAQHEFREALVPVAQDTPTGYNPSTAAPRVTAGVDWAKDDHAVCVVGALRGPGVSPDRWSMPESANDRRHNNSWQSPRDPLRLHPSRTILGIAADRSRARGTLLGDRVAAIYDQVLPGDEGGAGAGQPGNGGGYLVGLSRCARPGWPVLRYALAGSGTPRRDPEAWGDSVDCDSVRCGVDCGGAGEADHARLGGSVADVRAYGHYRRRPPAIMMILPHPRLVMAGSAALVTRKAVVRLRASAACQVIRSIDSTVPDSNWETAAEIMPALSTTMSSRPHRSSPVDTSLGAASASVRSATIPAASKPAVRSSVTLFLDPGRGGADHDGGAEFGEQPGGGDTDTVGIPAR